MAQLKQGLDLERIIDDDEEEEQDDFIDSSVTSRDLIGYMYENDLLPHDHDIFDDLI